jgi:transposase
MLNVEERFMIKDLHRKGVSISDIARLTGRDRKTVRRLLEVPLVPPPTPRHVKPRKIDIYAPYLEHRIDEGVLNARKLYAEILDQGYPGKESQVRAFVHPFRQARQAQATVRFETEPGEQGQFDWGHFGVIRHDGRQRHLYAFVMTLSWSRMMYLEFTVAADELTFLRCHVHAFHYFDGFPRHLLHDNLKTAVLARAGDGTPRWHPRYLDFADYYGFSPRACRPYRPQTKGKVESGVKYVRGNFWPGLKFTDLADLNLQARIWLDRVANVRLHGTTGEVPALRFPRENLQSLAGKPDYDTSLTSARRSSRDCLVSYLGNLYSVPAAYARQQLLVKETEQGELIILSLPGQEEVARHRLVPGRNQRVVVAAHYQDILTGPRPPARAEAVQLPAAELTLFGVGPAPQVEARALSVYDQFAEVPA